MVPSVSSTRSSPSLWSVASSTAKSARKTVRLLRKAVKNGAAAISRPFKKRHSSPEVLELNSGVDEEESSTHGPVAVDTDSDMVPEATGETDKEELKQLNKTWCSPAYGFFKSKIEIGYEDGRKFHYFKCAAKCCKGKGEVCRYQDSQDRTATSNLKMHAVKCFGADAVDATFNYSWCLNICLFCTTWPASWLLFTPCPHHGRNKCAESNQPMNIVKDRQFEILMKTGRPSTTLPSPTTVSHNIKVLFECCHKQIDKILKEHPGLVHFTTDAWTSPNHCAFVAWTVHLHHNSHLLVFVLDVIEVPASHMGEALAEAFQQMLIDHGLVNKILKFNSDNTSSNDTQTACLNNLPNSFDAIHCVQCFNHTMQLSAQALLKLFNAASTDADDNTDADDISDGTGITINNKDEGDECDSSETEYDGDVANEEDDDEAEDPLEVLDEEEQVQLLQDMAAMRTMLSKVQKFSFAVIHSTTIALPTWRKTCTAHSLPIQLIPHDITTRWNSTYDMLKVVLKYRPAVDDITANKNLKLRKYELDDDDWCIIADLLQVLKIYKDATLFFSKDSVSCITYVIPTMDCIDALLSNANTKPLSPSVKHALMFVCQSIDKYYSRTNMSNVYHIAMVLHPQLKLKYFHQHNWEKDWISMAEEIVQEEFSKYKKSQDTTPAVPKSATNVDDMTNFLNLLMDGIEELNELDKYLAQPIETVCDPIVWWWDHRAVFPQLSAMALDYLSAPATSTAVEHLFSQGCQLLHFTCNWLSPSMIRAFLCFGDWGKKDLVDMEEISVAIQKAQLGQKYVASELGASDNE